MKTVGRDQVLAVNEGSAVVPDSWISRMLYVGSQGAANWLAVAGDPKYPLKNEKQLLLAKNRASALKGTAYGTLVSLGPGDGSADVDLIGELSKVPACESSGTDRRKRNQRQIRYIPVDISKPLLELTVATVQPHAEVPVAVLGDFEQDWDILANAVKQHAVCPVVYSLLGGTLGNLDCGERAFFNAIRTLMAPDDGLLMDIPLAGPRWTPESDPRLNLEEYSEAFQRFLRSDLRNASSPSRMSRVFSEWAAVTHDRDPDIGCEIITVRDQSCSKAVITFRRYHWHAMLRWVESSGFRVRFASSSIASELETFGMGIVLLSRI